MVITQNEIGKQLKNELDKGYNINRIANRPFDLYFELRNPSYDGIDEILQLICMMEAGPEFVYMEKELRILGEML